MPNSQSPVKHHQFAAKPPMGWNSWDCFGTTVTEEQIRAQAVVMADKLKDFGWEYIVVDIQWYEPNSTGHDYNPQAKLTHDAFGRLQPAPNRFPSAKEGSGFTGLAKTVHGLGLKFGIHLMRGIPRICVDASTPVMGTNHFAKDIANTASTCSWNPDMYGVDMTKPGAQEYYDSVFLQFAAWGVDFVKVDDISRPYHDNESEIEAIRRAIDKSGRPMVLSLSPGETALTAANHATKHANMWRISDDFWDDWKLLFDQFERCKNWAAHVGDGHWPDADMLPIGKVRFGQDTRFTSAERHTMMNLWAIFRSPLILGCDLSALDDQTLSLITNPDLIKVNQLGSNPRALVSTAQKAVWVSQGIEPGHTNVALFNLTDVPQTITANLQDIFGQGAPGAKYEAKHLWTRHTDAIESELKVSLEPHSSAIFSMKPMEQTTRRPAQPVDIRKVRLLPSRFQDAQKVNGEYLLSLDIDRLLSRFRTSAGLKPKAEAYGGWESATISGHSLGHLLSGLAWHFGATGDERHKVRAAELTKALAECQANRQDGYVGGIPDADKVWAELRNGEIRSQGFDLNGIWVPWYTIHKVLAGLIDTFELCDDTIALEVAKKLADWAIWVTENLTPELWQKMLACEHGGINESLFHLARLTKYEKYKILGEKFDHHAVLNPLRDGKDPLAGIHGNTQVPKLLGLAVHHDITGDESDRKAAETFWKAVAEDRTYANGGNSNYEYFGQAKKLRNQLSPNTSETCNTYNMLKLTRHLFAWEPTSSKFEYYEKALYNHIYASQDGNPGEFTYYVPLSPRASRPYSKPFDDFWCCVGTGMENHARYGDSIFFTGQDLLYINLFIPARLEWKEQDFIAELSGSVPESSEVDFHIVHAEKRELTIAVRIPIWATGKFNLKLNGKPLEFEIGSDGYARIKRAWTSGETVNISVPSSIRTESMPDDPSRVAVLLGPVLLAADSEDLEMDPVFVTHQNSITGDIKPTQNPLEYTSNSTSIPPNLNLKPFWSFTKGKYTTYFDILTPTQWNEKKTEIEAEHLRQAKLKANTTDELRIGEMQPERDHNLNSEKSDTGSNQDRKWRHAEPNGYFEFELKVDPKSHHELLCTYWGADFNRDLKILINGTTIVEKRVTRRETPGFFEEGYAVPLNLTEGQNTVKVRFQASEKTLTPGLYGCRMVKVNS